jgi:hypothetical protein
MEQLQLEMMRQAPSWRKAHLLGEMYQMMKTAILHNSNFNIIHKETVFEVDIFVGKARPFDRSQFTRRKAYILSTNPERTAYFASPEDNILAKLKWYQLGVEILLERAFSELQP